MWKVFIVLLFLILAIGLAGKSKSVFSGGKDNDLIAIIVLKTPLGVQEMRKNYIKTDSQKPHITLGYLSSDFDEQAVFKHLRSIKPNPIVFDKWNHTKSFIGLLPQNTDEIKRIIGPMAKYITTGPRGGYHMSIAYRANSAPVDGHTHKKAHDLIQVPISCPVAEVRFSKRKNGEWEKYKSVTYC